MLATVSGHHCILQLFMITPLMVILASLVASVNVLFNDTLAVWETISCGMVCMEEFRNIFDVFPAHEEISIGTLVLVIFELSYIWFAVQPQSMVPFG